MLCILPTSVLQKMVGPVTKTPAKRALAEASNNHVNASPRSAKKLKFENGSATRGSMAKKTNGSFNSSQPGPSQFEDTLEKMTQDIESLKTKNTEKDQQWRRPPLPEDFNEMTSKFVFQQIEAEESVLNGGKPAVKLFGVTEVRSHSCLGRFDINPMPTERSLSTIARHRVPPLFLCCCADKFPQRRLQAIPDIPRERMPKAIQSALGCHCLGTDVHERKHPSLPGQPEKPIP